MNNSHATSEKRRLDDLTVFVISTGEETETDCIAALKEQDSTFRIEHIRGVTPMSAAFQAMPDRVQTKYFLQVDADMILNTDAVSRLYDAVRASPFWIYRVAGTLYEEGFGVGGAVKCWKRSFFRFFRFNDVRTVDRDLHRRAARWGFRIAETSDTVGIHRPRHSEFSLYLKTKSDVEKWRFLKRGADQYALPLLDEILATESYRAPRLLGCLLGAMTGPARLVRSKDAEHEQRCLDGVRAALDLGASMEAPGLGNSPVHEMRDAFIRAYGDFRLSEPEARLPLAQTVTEIFGGGDMHQLLAALDQ